ncbi:MAG UNVERIFIED_CONTAM: pyruvate dehydrogenase (acetyl-transferring) E1 component subunit alpha [Rickettsiaceae bacterium]|jgi:pyruvate dehydrogenase E1 component alpha subunit
MDKKQYVEAYRKMLLIRRFEERCGQLYGMGLIAGFCHLYIGQEAVITGIHFAMQKGDHTITSYRDHGHIIIAGTDPKAVLAELTGRVGGCSKGKGGSMHMFDPENNFHGGHGIVGAQVPLGTGIAFAEKYKGTDNICYVFFGDGAAQQGQVFEAFNMAKLWNLPVIYIIENNEYSMGTAVHRSTGMQDLWRRGESLGVPGKRVDAMDIDNVFAAAKEAAEYVRSGKGPFILEMKTYRYRGHSMSDPAKYRSKEEVEDYKENKDPIAKVRNKILANKYATEDELKSIEKEIKTIVQEAADFATSSPEPSLDELYTDVFVK